LQVGEDVQIDLLDRPTNQRAHGRQPRHVRARVGLDAADRAGAVAGERQVGHPGGVPRADLQDRPRALVPDEGIEHQRIGAAEEGVGEGIRARIGGRSVRERVILVGERAADLLQEPQLLRFAPVDADQRRPPREERVRQASRIGDGVVEVIGGDVDAKTLADTERGPRGGDGPRVQSVSPSIDHPSPLLALGRSPGVAPRTPGRATAFPFWRVRDTSSPHPSRGGTPACLKRVESSRARQRSGASLPGEVWRA